MNDYIPDINFDGKNDARDFVLFNEVTDKNDRTANHTPSKGASNQPKGGVAKLILLLLMGGFSAR